MSNTYRRSAATDANTIVKFINQYNRTQYKTHKVMRSVTELAVLYSLANIQYANDMLAYKKSCTSYYRRQNAQSRMSGPPTIPIKQHVRKYTYMYDVISKEELMAEAVTSYRKMQRDGYLSETGRKTGFKKQAAKTVRNANKRIEKQILKDIEYNTSYPHRKLGKPHVWNWW